MFRKTKIWTCVAEESSSMETKAEDTVTEDLAAALDASEGATVVLVAGEMRLAAHRAVLAARSPVFGAMFRHDTLEASSGVVTISDVEGPVLRLVVGYCYKLKSPQPSSMSLQLLEAADKYGLLGLKADCEQQLAARLTVENAADTAVFAVRYPCPTLKSAAISFIWSNPQVFDTQGWADAEREQPEETGEVNRLLDEQREEIRRLPAEEKDRRLLEAAKVGAVAEVKELLTAGADVAARGGWWWTPLHYAACNGHLEVARCLVTAGAEVDARDEVQTTPLHRAAFNGCTDVMRLLLANSADPNVKNKWGWTPMHDAASNGFAEAVAVLLEAGANRRVRTGCGETALDIARQKNHLHLVDMLRLN
ncbi:poly [ADP-ribose] polymerase tankyrase-2-like isoform X1 [Schistocerca nitens]|uniref:poly [ADP-ribose] polymerase tankyrase-2-like isoform X1 n=2 Tax=Schistocerca nitens TaxID=7011 RepID=UPI00211921A4|nr:poly [ADP-ribose] polymerase tankyrase-2-like isoform X1 [Schistocerca nitens]